MRRQQGRMTDFALANGDRVGAMRYRALGRSDLRVSVISFGCWQFERAWAPTYEPAALRRAAESAIDHGVNFFDTAAAYGDGESERLLGEIIRARRDRLVIATKLFAPSYDAAQLERQVHESLARLRTDYIDLCQIHWPKVPFTRADGEDLVAAFELLRDKGHIRWGGVSNFRDVELACCPKRPDLIVTNQLPYNALWRMLEERDLAASHKNSLGLVAYSSLAEGFLAGRFALNGPFPTSHRARLLFSQPQHYGFVMSILDDLAALAVDVDRPMVQIAINWLLSKPYVSSAICGARTQKQVEQQLAALQWEMSGELARRVDDITDPLTQRFHGCSHPWIGDRPAP